MKTFLEQLQEAVGVEYPLKDILNNLTDEEIITEINLFAKEVAKEALKNASLRDGCIFADGERYVHHSLVTDENNIPKL